MSISAEVVRQLREETGAGMMDCKTRPGRGPGRHGEGPRAPAQEGPRRRRRRRRAAPPARAPIGAYIHAGRQGRRPRRGQLRDRLRGQDRRLPGAGEGRRHAHRGRLPAAALYVSKDEVPAEVLEKEKEIYRAQAAAAGQARERRGQDRRGQAQGVLRDRSACSSSPSSRTRSSPSASSSRRRSRSSRRTSSSAASRASAWARSRGRRPPPSSSTIGSPGLPGGPGRAAGKDLMPGTKKALAYKRILLKLSGRGPPRREDLRHRPQLHRLPRHRDPARSTTSASRSRPWSAAATSSAASPTAPRAWTASPPTTWACWPR